MKLGLFATAGHTEVGGLQSFLESWLGEDVQVQRKFPTRRKRPKKSPVSIPVQTGDTGQQLIDAACAAIDTYGLADVDAVVFADDADCRFGCDAKSGLQEFEGSVVAALRKAAGDPALTVFVLLASPEAEAWFAACPEQTFAHASFLRSHHSSAGTAEYDVRKALDGLKPEAGWEAYGCPPSANGTSCTHKLSTDIIAALNTLPHCTRAFRKGIDGGLMLKELNPSTVVERCPRYAAPTLHALKKWAHSQAPSTP